MEDHPATPSTEKIPNLVTEGHIWRSVWLLSWPSIISMFLQTAYGYINMYFVGHVSKEAVAAVGIGNSVLFLQFAFLSGVGVGTSALVARFVGAENLDEANEATRQSVILTAVLSILTGVLGIVLAPRLVSLLGAQKEVVPIAVSYLQIQLAGGVPVFTLYILTSAFRALGDMKSPLYVMLLATVLNVLLDWLLVFGAVIKPFVIPILGTTVGPIVVPELGAPGTSYAVVISRIISLALAYWFLARSPLAPSMSQWWEVHTDWFWRIMRIGIPAALQGLLRSGSSVFYMVIFGLTAYATTNIAALTIGLRAESLAFMPGFAFSMAATALVGQNLGARQPERAAHAGWVAATQGAIIMSLLGAIFFVFAEPFARLFISSPDVVERVVSYLRINALSEPFLALGMILTGALQGAGETRWPTIITFFTMYMLRLPLTYLLMYTMGLDVVAAWWVMTGSVVVGGILTTLVFLRGRWREIEV